jgi:hypothetical protein
MGPNLNTKLIYVLSTPHRHRLKTIYIIFLIILSMKIFHGEKFPNGGVILVFKNVWIWEYPEFLD